MSSSRYRITLLCAATVAALFAQADETSRKPDEELLKEAKLGTDGPALLQFFRDRTLSGDKRKRLPQAVRQLGDQQFKIRQEASRILVNAGKVAIPLLRTALKDSDPEIALRAAQCLDSIENGSEIDLAEAAARLLAERRPDGATQVVLDYLPYACDGAVEDELHRTLAVLGLRDGEAEPTLVKALMAKSTTIRGAAALVIAQSSDAEERARAKLLLKDPDAVVRLQAARGLVAGKEKEAVPVLVELLKNGPKDVAWQAEGVLFRIAGDKSPQAWLGAGTDVDREKCGKAWTAWWNTNADALDLSGYKLKGRYLSRVLFVAVDIYGLMKGRKVSKGGKIWERRPDGTEAWAISGLKAPCDAHLLPGNRVLVAERSGGRVTERDTKGTILWQYDVPKGLQSLVSCQRLSTGNTFIATFDQIMEVTRDKKIVFQHKVHNDFICAATKLRNGRILYVTTRGKLIEMSTEGKEQTPVNLGGQAGWTSIQSLPGGRFLVPRCRLNDVVEIDRTGRVITSYKSPYTISAYKLPNGNLLVCQSNLKTIAEITRSGKTVWSEQINGPPVCVRGR